MRDNRESDDGPGMTLLELAAVADLDVGTEPVTEATYKRCIDALIEKQKDIHNNVLFCAVCDMFDKKDQFKAPFNARNITDTKLLNGMRERLSHSAWVNQNLDPLPSARDQGVFDFDGCLEQALEVGKTHGNGALQDLILSKAGFKYPAGAPADLQIADEFNVCKTCYNSLTSPSKKNLPPTESLANHTFIGTCWLPKLTDVQYKMLSLVYTKTEVVIYKMYKGAHQYLTAHVLSYANKTPVDPEMFPILNKLPHKLTKQNFTAVFAGTFEEWAKVAARYVL